jgi:large repetitive protein
MTLTATPKSQVRATTTRRTPKSKQVKSKQVAALVVIDSAVEHHQLLAKAVTDSAAVVILDRHQDGVQQILAAMQRLSSVTTIHIIANSAPGCLQLGNMQLNSNTLDRYGWDLLTGFSDQTFSLSFYSGRLAAGGPGAEFVQKLHHFTGANIAASTQPVGKITRGSWALDHRIGQVNAVLPISQDALDAYSKLQGQISL